MECQPHVVVNTSYICMETCSLLHWPLNLAAYISKSEIIEYSDSVISTSIVCGVTDCALGMVLPGDTKKINNF